MVTVAAKFDFHVAHRRSLASGGGDNSLANLVPLCSRCNHGMTTQSLKVWERSVLRGFTCLPGRAPGPRLTLREGTKVVRRPTPSRNAGRPGQPLFP